MIWSVVLGTVHRQKPVQDRGHGRERPGRAAADIRSKGLSAYICTLRDLDYYACAMALTQLSACLGLMSAFVLLR